MVNSKHIYAIQNSEIIPYPLQTKKELIATHCTKPALSTYIHAEDRIYEDHDHQKISDPWENLHQAEMTDNMDTSE